MLIKPSTALRNEYLDLREKLLSAEANRLSGAKTYTVAEASERLRGLISKKFNVQLLQKALDD